MAQKIFVYRAQYSFNNLNDITGLSQIPMSEGDTIEVHECNLPSNVDFEAPAVWLNGYNRTNGKSGHIPGNFLQFISETIRRRHVFLGDYFLKPTMCNLCDDYIWGSNTVGMKCEACATCYHQTCSEIALNNNNHLCSGGGGVTTPSESAASSLTVREWTTTNVVEWMSAVNMCNYIEAFKLKKIDGGILTTLTEEKLRKTFGIEDAFHRKSLMICINELCGHEQDEGDEDESEECTSDGSEHRLSDHTFTSIQRCHKCNKYLYGIIRQGLQCQVCGLCVHRECAEGKVPACGDDRLQLRRRASFTTEPLFGIDLESQCLLSGRGRDPPELLVVCTEEIQRVKDETKIEWEGFYRTPVSTEAVGELKRQFDDAADVRSVSFAGVKPSVIGGLVKKYLRELANPVIPVEYYDRFIDAAKISDADMRSKHIVSLVNELPEHHNSTLNYMMSHLFRITQYGNIEESRKKLAQVFCHILLRPGWNEITKLVHNTEFHLRILEQLFINTAKDSNADYTPNLRPAPPYINRPVPPIPSTDYMHESLDQCGWFWGDISKEEVHERLNGTPDGTFLVRRATTHATHGDYTLTLRKGGMNRLIKIFHKNDRYGFSEPCEFSSVQHLVEHFTTHSLAEYNRQLNCTLDYPMVNVTMSEHSVDDSQVLRELQQVHREYLARTLSYEKDLDKQGKTTQDIQMLYQAFDSFKELVKVFEEQIELHKQNSRNIAANDYSKLQQNNTVLESRLRDITDSKNRLEASIKEKAAENRRIIAIINSKKPEIKQLSKKCEQLRSTLLNNGHDKKYIDEILDSGINGQLEPARLIPHMDQTTWYKSGVDRSHAQIYLRGKSEGTFLIRQKGPEEYALSIVNEYGQDIHCRIFRGPEGYGFADPFMTHEQLMDLVLHYRETSLAEHNPTLNSKLLYPAYAS